MKCINGICDKNAMRFKVCKEKAINPQTCEIGDLRRLFGYYLYKSPNTSSYQSEKLDESYHEKLFEEMNKSWDKNNRLIISFNLNFESESAKLALCGDEVCSCCKRYVCKRKKPNKGNRESDLDCFLRHIRNSLAHGRVFVIHGGSSIKIMFEDYDIKNKAISSRIVCNQSDLKKWQILINKYMNAQKNDIKMS